MADRLGRGDPVGIGHDEDEVARSRTGRRQQRGLSPLEELRGRPMERSVGLDREVDEALRAVALGEIGQLVELLPRVVADAGRQDAEDGPAGGDRLGEDAEVDLANRIGQVGELHPEADVGLVGSVSVHGLRERQPREGLVQQRPFGEHLLRDAR